MRGVSVLSCVAHALVCTQLILVSYVVLCFFLVVTLASVQRDLGFSPSGLVGLSPSAFVGWGIRTRHRAASLAIRLYIYIYTRVSYSLPGILLDEEDGDMVRSS